MDALSQLVRMMGLEARLDLRCQFAEGFSVDHARVAAREIEFHLVLHGQCLVEVEGHDALHLRAGDFLALPGRLAHRVRGVGPIDASHRLRTMAAEASGLPLRQSVGKPFAVDLLCGRFTYESGAIDTLFETLPNVLHVSLTESTPQTDLVRMVSLIRAEVDGEEAGAAIVVASLCTALLTLALRAGSRRKQMAASLLRLIGDARLARATQAILGEPGRDWTLTQLADIAAMSRATFARRFAEAAATTPRALLLDVRMSRAACLLRRTRRSVADIATETGYQSEAAFAKAFRRSRSVSPSAFRRAARQESGEAAAGD